MNHKRHGLAALALAGFGVAALAPDEPPRSSRGEAVWSCQLHLHGSFSEDVGSINSHSFEASDVGADVLWWSDHDYRITSYGMYSSFGFEHPNQAADDDPLLRQKENYGRDLWLYEKHADRRAVGGWDIVEDRVEGDYALRMDVHGKNNKFEGRYIRLGSENSRLTRPLAADLRLHLSVKPLASGVDAHGVVLLDLSEHPVFKDVPGGDTLSFEQLRLRYVIGGPAFEPWLEEGTYSLHVAVPDDAWTRIELNPTADAERGFPSIVGRDNSMNRIGFGAEARKQTEFACLFDDLRIENLKPAAEMYAIQRELIAEVGAAYPSLRQLQGAEISYVSEHLNEYSVETELLDYAALAAEVLASDDPTHEHMRSLVLERAIEGAHARGGLVSYNHMFGASWSGQTKRDKHPEALREVRDLIGKGIDLLEVGYVSRGGQRLYDHLWVWDKLASEGLSLIGTGVSDSHGGSEHRWRTGQNNFVSWVFAPSTDKADLIEGLRAGRVFFGDLLLFDGALDLLSDRGFAMGQIVLTDRDEVEVAIRAEGSRKNQSLHVIENGRHVDTLFIKGVEYAHTLTIDPVNPTVMRVELHDRQDLPRVFTNALNFLREAPPTGIPAARAGLDFAGLVAVRFEGFDLLGAKREESGAVVLRGLVPAEAGSFTLDTTGFPGTPVVELQDLEGSWKAVEGGLSFSGLLGSGTIRISAAP